jgi:hypothetical protein
MKQFLIYSSPQGEDGSLFKWIEAGIQGAIIGLWCV